MIDWIYSGDTDSYKAELMLGNETPLMLSLSLTHSYPARHWMLSAKSTEPSAFTLRTVIDADPQHIDIDDVKRRAEQALADAMHLHAGLLSNASDMLSEDSGTPMPSKHDMARRLWSEFASVRKSTDDGGKECIGVNWRSFQAGCRTSYIRAWFERNFGVDVKTLTEDNR